MRLYSCPRCGESIQVDVLGRIVPHPSRTAPRMDCTASRHKPKHAEQVEREGLR